MALLSKSLFAGVAVLALSPFSALALPQDCDVKCTASTRCSVYCAEPWSTNVITCGEWGVCAFSAKDDAPEEVASETSAQDNAELVCSESREAASTDARG